MDNNFINEEKIRSLETTIHILNKLLSSFEGNFHLSHFFCDNNIKTVVIYGLGFLGVHLYESLKNEAINVVSGIDMNASQIHVDGINVYSLEEEIPDVDAIIVTPVKCFYEIECAIYEKLKETNKIDTHIISLETVVNYER